MPTFVRMFLVILGCFGLIAIVVGGYYVIDMMIDDHPQAEQVAQPIVAPASQPAPAATAPISPEFDPVTAFKQNLEARVNARRAATKPATKPNP